MSETQTLNPAAQNALQLAEQGEITTLDDAWLEMVNNVPLTATFYDDFFRAMRRAHELDKALELCVVALNEITARQEWAALLEVVETLGHRWPAAKELRPFASKALKGVHADIPQLAALLQTCRGIPLDKLFDNFRAHLNMLPGEAYHHHYWGQGIVQNLDLANGKITLQFPEETKTITLDFLRKHLRHLPSDSFLGMRTVAAEKLSELAFEDPCEVVKLALRSEGGEMKQSQLKTLLIEGVIDEDEWTSWWTKARKALQIDPLVDLDTRGGAHAGLALRDKPRTLAEEATDMFFGQESDIVQRIGALQYLADTRRNTGGTVDAALLARMAKALEAEYFHLAPTATVARIQHAAAAEDLRRLADEDASLAPTVPPLASLLTDLNDYEILLAIEPAEVAVAVLIIMLERDGDQGREFASYILPQSQLKLAQAIWKELDVEHHAQIAVRAIRTLTEDPLANHETFFWAARNIAEKKWEHLEDYLPMAPFVYDLFDSLENWHRIVERNSDDKATMHAARFLMNKVRALLQTRNCAALCSCVEQLSFSQAQDLRRAIQLSNAFTNATREMADNQIVMTRKDMQGQPSTANSATSTETENIHCTLLGQNRAVRELHELNTVKIPQNAKDIETARAEGDLKENAGYHGARDKHVLLLQQAHELGHDISRARIVRGENVNTSVIGFGTEFHTTNTETGETEKYIVMGRWESEPDRRIFSYQAPFIQCFLSKKVGDLVPVKIGDGPETTYRVDAIKDGLTGTDYDREA